MVMLIFRISDWGFRIEGKKRVLFAFVVLLMSVLGAVSGEAQDVQAVARVDSHNVLIGDWIRLHVEVQHPDSISVQFPSAPDSLEGMEIVKRDSVVRKKSDKNVLESTIFTVTAFDSGTYIIPPLVVRYTAAGDKTVHTAKTSPIPIIVHSVSVDTTKDIRDIKPPASLPISFAELLPYFIGVVVAGGVVWLIYYIMKKRKKGEPILPETPPRPPHEIALEALHSLEAEKLWQRGMVKEFQSKLTNIIRSYIEQRFSIMAMEMVTDEILSSSPIAALDKKSKVQLQEMLMLADLVKFAKFHPLPEEHERGLSSAFSFVEATAQKAPEQVKRQIAQEANT